MTASHSDITPSLLLATGAVSRMINRLNSSKSMLPPLRIADPLTGEFALLLHRGCERRCAGALGEIMRVGPVSADRGGYLLVGDLDDAGDARANHRECIRIGDARRDAVGEVLLLFVRTTVPAANDNA